MSDPSARKPIPMGILVAKRASASCASTPEKADTPPPKRKDDPLRQLPWLYIAFGGSAAWVVAILVIAICANSQGAPTQGPQIAVNGQGAGQPNPAAPFVAPEVDEFRGDELDRKPNEPAPRLVRHLPKRNVDMPPDLVVDVEGPKPAPKLAKLDNPAPLGLKPRKEVDLVAFADCNQIGTDVLFHRDVPTAFEVGGKEKKLVFVVHLSGNLEDKDFT